MRANLQRSWSRISASRRAATVCAVFYLAFFAFYFAERPSYDWDMLAYIAVALHIEGTPAARIHDETYDILRSSVPRAWVDNLTGNFNQDAVAVGEATTRMSDIDLRQDWAAHSDSFAAQLPFFSVKPLYPALMALGNGLGLPLIQSGLVVSAVSFVLIGLTLYAWFLHWMPPFVALGAMALLVLNPWLVILARSVGPDILSIAFLLGGAYFAMQDRPVVSAIIFVVSITARPENLLYAGTFLCYLGIVRGLSLLQTGGFLVAAFLAYLGVSSLSNNYGWKTLFYFVFVNRSARPGAAAPHIGLQELVLAYIGRLDRIFLGQGELPVFALIGYGAVCLKLRARHAHEILRDKYAHLIVIAVVAGLARIVLLPTEAFRGLLPTYMLLSIALVNACSTSFAPPARPSMIPR
jgi:hypothetical protein